jgi:hypothetical protein
VEKTLTDGMISIEQKDSSEPIYLLHRSFSGAIHFKSLIFAKSSKVKVVDKFKVKIRVSVHHEDKY